ncbi:MAG TPA: polysaccharide biosynthesis/export family protein [Terriglobales bacterium]|nr:polysaccharide biosynthesis/export family protein [Terriglobales bacterium]
MVETRFFHKAVQALIVVFALAVGVLAQNNAVAKKASAKPASDKAVEKGADVKAGGKAPSALDDPLTYRIGVEDELGVSVWREPDLSINAVVRPDGMITLPLLNDLKVTGMTTKELQDMLTERLKEFLKEPQVTVIVRQIRSRKVYLLGEVVRPGTYSLNNPKTVLQLLAEAGGPGAYAKLGAIYVIRQQNGAQTRLSFHYKKAMSGSKASDDLVLQPGDMVVVP